MKALFAAALLVSGMARADLVLSHGPSIPVLEYTGGTHPVSFAKGVGYQLALGLGQFAFLNQSWDALDFSALAFGSAVTGTDGAIAGTLQVGLMIGTLNNLVSVGAAVPLLDGNVGAFQGSFKVYPLLAFNIPVAWEALAPPISTTPGPMGLPRGGTLYFGSGPRP